MDAIRVSLTARRVKFEKFGAKTNGQNCHVLKRTSLISMKNKGYGQKNSNPCKENALGAVSETGMSA